VEVTEVEGVPSSINFRSPPPSTRNPELLIAIFNALASLFLLSASSSGDSPQIVWIQLLVTFFADPVMSASSPSWGVSTCSCILTASEAGVSGSEVSTEDWEEASTACSSLGFPAFATSSAWDPHSHQELLDGRTERGVRVSESYGSGCCWGGPRRVPSAIETSSAIKHNIGTRKEYTPFVAASSTEAIWADSDTPACESTTGCSTSTCISDSSLTSSWAVSSSSFSFSLPFACPTRSVELP